MLATKCVVLTDHTATVDHRHAVLAATRYAIPRNRQDAEKVVRL